MRTVGLLFLISVSACWATLDSGAYELGDLLVRHAPTIKQDGRAWDPFGGASDIDPKFPSDYTYTGIDTANTL